ncbi:uncharacterized protein MYCFIDRAFT_125702 [Pseudocercospora fijiensis CIRAD86]|uniref:Kinesin-like protein n=1 Tax=Pseudocercospora fijiensis (strain CIRAD86) TaxID=383855 RepID=N1QBU9_PSEFD|nr:uncharacterized protein MYCFIDRAFT_125702 [Pseudocercospora fijiensis CIRAD86]EME88747.1 hypothetical protein MYCFIDRAFT_125702 [Pseudocercospora fijiensis CIRAD86]
MEPSKGSSALFSVFLRLRPSTTDNERFLDVEEPTEDAPTPTHITIKPSANDKRKRAVERFAFTRVYEENAGQRDIFDTAGILPMIEGVLGAPGREGRDGLLATLGVTGSGKVYSKRNSHTILGSKTQRGLTQLALDVLFRSTEPQLADADSSDYTYNSLIAADATESTLFRAQDFLDSIYDNGNVSRLSRAATPALNPSNHTLHHSPSKNHLTRFTRSIAKLTQSFREQESSFLSAPGAKRYTPRVSVLPTSPSIDDIAMEIDESAEYGIVVSMYEVYNDRIFDLLTATASGKSPAKRRALLFKSTEGSPERKVVAGLRKVICSSLEEALLVLETGLQERRVAGTGSNAVSSRSHGFFCIDVKKRHRGRGIPGPWTSSTMTIVDLAGSERARQAKTAGATLAEAGKINESLMYLGQCMQMQSDNSHNPPQKAIMIVTADPLGDFNATSQILRYSALAREVTVPRIPSITSQIQAGTSYPESKCGYASGRQTPSSVMQDLEGALTEITRLREELEITQVRLEEETNRRMEAEAAWAQSEVRIDAIEEQIRAEVYDEMDAKLETERRRWRAARDEEMDRQDEHMDRKIDLLTLSSLALKGPGRKVSAQQNGRVSELEDENARLRAQLANMEREKGPRSPSKKMRVLKTRKWEGEGMSFDDGL